MTANRRGAEAFVGLATLGCAAAGVLGVAGAVIALFQGDFSGMGLSAIAAALAFGLLANAVLRD